MTLYRFNNIEVCFGMVHRRGVSLVEVLFAMMIAVFGLAGVLAIFPLAARQAADSYSLNQATNGVMNVAAASASADMFPTETAPWIVDDDVTATSNVSGTNTVLDAYTPPLNNFYSGDTSKPVKSIRNLYAGLEQKQLFRDVGARPYPNGYTPDEISSVRRQINGQGFCYDPLYMGSVNQANWANQGKAWNDFSGGLIRRTRMPCFGENLNPTSFSGGQFTMSTDPTVVFTPRLIRVSSLQNINFSVALPPSPLTAASANLRVSSIGDLIPTSSQEDKSFGALRDFDGVDNKGLIAASSNSELSWFATIVPMENKSLDFPTQFTVTVVVLKKRDRTFDIPDGTSAITSLPVSERIALVTAMGSTPSTPMGVPGLVIGMPYSTGSLLNTTLHFDSRSQPTLRVGDYVMLSRNVSWTLPDTSTNGAKYVHRHAWYRVAAVGEREDSDLGATPEFSRDVVLQGRAWDYPDLNLAVNSPVTQTPPYISLRTTATILENVVAVYEYPITIND